MCSLHIAFVHFVVVNRNIVHLFIFSVCVSCQLVSVHFVRYVFIVHTKLQGGIICILHPVWRRPSLDLVDAIDFFSGDQVTGSVSMLFQYVFMLCIRYYIAYNVYTSILSIYSNQKAQFYNGSI